MDIREAVLNAYSKAADDPAGSHPFPVGRAFAESIGYPPGLFDRAPAAVAAFTGVSNVSIFAALQPDEVVLDLGCGAGLDSFVAASRVGPAGRVYGVDFSPSMLRRAPAAPHMLFVLAAGERLPFPAASFDAALVNGVFNLNPCRAAIFHELARVVRPGGSVYGAELVLREPLPAAPPPNPADWFA